MLLSTSWATHRPKKYWAVFSSDCSWAVNRPTQDTWEVHTVSALPFGFLRLVAEVQVLTGWAAWFKGCCGLWKAFGLVAHEVADGLPPCGA